MTGKWSENTRWICPDDDTETNLARDKLDSLLQELRENPNKTKESSRYRDDSFAYGTHNVLPTGTGISPGGGAWMSSMGTTGASAVDDKSFLGGPGSSIGLLSGKSGLETGLETGPIVGGVRKRKGLGGRGDIEEISTDRGSDPYIIRVYDRAVDFARFDENTPIYPMARAWIRNMNQGDTSTWTDIGSSIHGQPTDEENHANDAAHHNVGGDSFYVLPKPLDGRRDADVRIPPLAYPIKSSSDNFVVYEENPDPNITPETLIADHLARWQDIRKRWKMAARENENRYIETYCILKEMYEKTGKDVAN